LTWGKKISRLGVEPALARAKAVHAKASTLLEQRKHDRVDTEHGERQGRDHKEQKANRNGVHLHLPEAVKNTSDGVRPSRIE
jgi:hypothetical protein